MKGKPVVKLATGERFLSIHAAAAAMGVHHESIRQALAHGWRSAGSHGPMPSSGRKRQEAA